MDICLCAFSVRFSENNGLKKDLWLMVLNFHYEFDLVYELKLLLARYSYYIKPGSVMEKISSIFVLGLLSSTAIAEVPNSFVPGEVATAAKFNENFTHLSSEISDVKNKVDNLSGDSGAASENTLPENTFLAKVNGVDMEVTNHMVGSYSIKTPTGFYINVDSEGYPGDDHLMYESDDCTGQAYKENYSFRDYEGKPLGYTFKNPVFPGVKSIVHSNGFLGYLDDELIKLNYSSFRNGRKCSKWENTRLVFKVLPNDPSVTGIDSMPLVIINPA